MTKAPVPVRGGLATALRSGSPDKERDRLRVLFFFGVVSLTAAPIFVYAYGTLGSPAASLAVLISIPFLLFTYVIWGLTRSAAVAGNWIIGVGYVLFFTLCLFTGGINGPSLTWSICIPMVATLVCGPRSGTFWLLMVLVGKIKFFLLGGCNGIPLSSSSPRRGPLPRLST